MVFEGRIYLLGHNGCCLRHGNDMASKQRRNMGFNLRRHSDSRYVTLEEIRKILPKIIKKYKKILEALGDE